MKIQLKCEMCGATYSRYACHVECNTHNFCSRECRNASRKVYGSNQLEYVLNHFGKQRLTNIAKAINVTTYGLQQQITKWRNEGYRIYAPGRGRNILNT